MKALPQVIDAQKQANRARWVLFVDPAGTWFEGHFPQEPLLPGVVQVGWAVHFATKAYALEQVPVTFKHIKFTQPIKPGAQLVLNMTRKGDAIRYTLACNEIVASSGTICL